MTANDVHNIVAKCRIGISYRYRDAGEHANALFRPLQERFGSDCVKDMHGIVRGENYRDAIEKEVESCSVLLVLIGRDFLTYFNMGSDGRELADPLRLEVAAALKSEHIRVFPVLVNRASMPGTQDLPPELVLLSSRNALELSATRFDADVDLLIQVVERACKDRSLAIGNPAVSPSSGSSPASLDIFLSYAREDLERARDIATALEAEGWSVFWDRRIPPGRSFEDYLEEQLNACRIVIVLWSPHSVASHWVRTEAAHGLDRHPPALVPILIAEATIPLSFRFLQAADLSAWRPGDRGIEFEELVRSIESFVARGS